ncbi:MAG: hypothetical protein J6T10_21785, partial [Methanobrevibacter sp.]|nr:hypothetical protein [Methanobrevibacter sp.]
DKDFAKRIVNHKILKEGATKRSQYDIERIKLSKNFIIDEVWQKILLGNNAKGIVKNGYLYVTKVLRKCLMDTEDIRQWLSSKNLLGRNPYWPNEGAQWDYKVSEEEANIFDNILID